MAEIITGPFHMDEQGFLATIEELIKRFDGYSSGKYLAELGKSTMNTVRSDLFRFLTKKSVNWGRNYSAAHHGWRIWRGP